MKLDLTINLGNIVTLFGMLVGLFLAYTKIRERLITIETQLGPLWNEYNDRRRGERRGEGH
jgi:hypothetical protein